MLTAERLREVLNYDPQSGEFRRRVDRGRGRGHRWKAGTIAGRKAQYIHINIDYALYAAHRLAWLYMTGEWPSRGIDHIDRDKHNNAWSNLRLADKSQNAMNSKMRSTNKYERLCRGQP